MKRFLTALKPFTRWLPDLSLTCRRATRLQSDALDRKLPARQRIGLRLHLLLCPWCRRYGKQLTFLRNATRQTSDKSAETIPQTLSTEARERIRQRLHHHTD